VSGDGVPSSQPRWQQHLVGGWGCQTICLTHKAIGPAHCPIPLCVRTTDLYFGMRLSVGGWGCRTKRLGLPPIAVRMPHNAPCRHRWRVLGARQWFSSAGWNRPVARPRRIARVPTGSTRHPTSAHRARSATVWKAVSRPFRAARTSIFQGGRYPSAGGANPRLRAFLRVLAVLLDCNGV
jgi:hypothetical protein